MSIARPNEGSSQPSSSTPVGFLSLEIELRNCIYREVLALPYPLFLFQNPGCPVESFAPEKLPQWLALLSTARQSRRRRRQFSIPRMRLLSTRGQTVRVASYSPS
ncbi:hypothetical protein BJX96DRAFT_100055 [Aspergillus floccosus]